MPTTSYPCDFKSAAVVEESTPPDMATTILVSSGRPSRSRLLRMVSSSVRAHAFQKRKVMAAQVSGASCSSGASRAPREKSLSNIGGGPPKQSREGAVSHHANGKTCRGGRKRRPDGHRKFHGLARK